MQTFLPVESYKLSAFALDDKRLGCQRKEAMQIAMAILDPTYGWQNHTAVRMWRGHGASLCVYGMVVCRAWIDRGCKDTLLQRFYDMQYLMTALGERIVKPPWIGDDNFHRSHQSNLLRKKPDWYGWMFRDNVGPDLPYVWPDGRARSGVRAEVRQSMPSNMTCPSCPNRPGFTNIGTSQLQRWVCSNCLRPTEMWLRSAVSRGEQMLNMFRGGPIDGTVYSTAMLLSPEGLKIPVLDYKWTPEEVRSSIDGRVAQVWIYSPGQTPGNVAPVAIQATQLKSSTPSTRNGVRRMSENPAENTEATAAPAPVVEVNTSDLRPRREAIKASRTVVAKEADITVAKLYRIETGGKRTTQEEVNVVRAALDRLEKFAAEQAEIAAQAEAAAQATAAAQPGPAEGTENGVADPS